jgi:ADP-heptose:LPS heptosyltransferase
LDYVPGHAIALPHNEAVIRNLGSQAVLHDDRNESRRLVPDVAKIVVLRANGLGDLIFALPALSALRAAYPGAELTLLGGPWHGAFLNGRGVVDRVIEVPAYFGVWNGEEDRTEQAAFFERMRAEHFDIAIQMHGGGRNSNPFVLQLGAKLTAGLRTPDAPALDRCVPYIYFQLEVHRYLEVAALLGAKAVEVDPSLPVLDRDLVEARKAFDLHGPLFVVIHPGATDGRRRWPAQKFAHVADELARRGLRVVVIGTSEESKLVGSVLHSMQMPAVDLSGRLSLSALAGLLSRAHLVVANDSGPVHLAAAVRARTVGVYWCGNLLNSGPLTRTRHRAPVSWRLNCPVCDANCLDGHCGHDASFVEEVPVEVVLSDALDLLALANAEHGLPMRQNI